MTLYRDTAFPLQIHIVEHLILHLLSGNSPGYFQKAIGQSALSVVNMSDNAKIPDMIHEWFLIVQFGAKITTNGYVASGLKP
jgi:hypothetical protein